MRISTIFTIIIFIISGTSMTYANDSIFVMTFNIRYDNPNDPNPWPKRHEHVAEMIGERYNTDFTGLQEALKHQVDDLLNSLPNYAYIGVGRQNGKQEGEHCAILYRKDKYEVLQHDTFWLSETPEEAGSQSWDSSLPRIVTWGKFKQKETGKVLYHFNTHFDHRGEQARVESAKLIWKKMKEITGGTPSVLTGDFNIRETSQPYKILSGRESFNGHTSELADTRYVSMNAHQGPTASFTRESWTKAGPPESMIDYIFVYNGFQVINHWTLDDKFGEHFPSDHLPVLTELQWPKD